MVFAILIVGNMALMGANAASCSSVASTSKASYADHNHSYQEGLSSETSAQPLTVEVQFGSIYFRGEEAQGYAQISLDGVPNQVQVQNINASLIYEGTNIASPTVSATDVVGMYLIHYQIGGMAAAGTYELQVIATNDTHSGVGMGGFQISGTLQGWDCTLISIDGKTADLMTRAGRSRSAWRH